MPTCYTCHEEITFDKTIRSVSGKQIPLWPDKKNTHAHDEAGNAIRQELPQPSQQTQSPQQQQYQQRVTNKLAEVGGGQAPQAQSQGGSYLDTKRIRVMLEELTSLAREIKDILETRVILYTNVYEGRMNAMFNAFSDALGTIGTPASELLKQKQQRQSIIDDTSMMINHSKKADEFERTREFTKADDNDDDAKVETED